MQRPSTFAGLALVWALLVAPLGGCNGPHPFVRDGDATGVEVFYSGNLSDALPVAKEHCAQYERVPRYVDASLGLAIFQCVPR